MEILTTDEDVKVNINAKKEDNEAVLPPLDERGSEKLETTVEDELKLLLYKKVAYKIR